MKHLLLALSILSYCFVRGQNSISSQLNAVIVPFEIHNDSLPLANLDTLLSTNQILALGEETHSTSEFFMAKSKIIRYCVLNLNYKVIGIEADFIATQYLNHYITQGVGSAKEGLYKMGTSAWMTAEILELVEWLHQYNLQKPNDEKVSFYGFDMQASNNTISSLKSGYLHSQWLKQSSMIYFDSIATWKTIDKNKQQLYRLLSQELWQYKDSLPLEKQNAFAEHVLMLDQYVSFMSAKNTITRLNLRDQYMAENIQLIHNKDPRKMIVWAHNEHISKKAATSNWQTMGSHLANKFLNQYFVVGLYTGNINLKYFNRYSKNNDSLSIPLDSTQNSLNTILSRCDKPNFFLDIQSTKNNSAVNSFVTQKIISRNLIPNRAKNNGYGFDESYSKSTALAERYDALIFLKNTRGANRLRYE